MFSSTISLFLMCLILYWQDHLETTNFRLDSFWTLFQKFTHWTGYHISNIPFQVNVLLSLFNNERNKQLWFITRRIFIRIVFIRISNSGHFDCRQTHFTERPELHLLEVNGMSHFKTLQCFASLCFLLKSHVKFIRKFPWTCGRFCYTRNWNRF